MFVKVTNGVAEYYTIYQLQQDNPDTSFPEEITKDVLAEYDVYEAVATAAPPLDSKTHRHLHTFELIDGVWTQVWTIAQLPEEQAAANVRAHRTQLLLDTDWVVIKAFELQTEIPQEYISYRQELRDVTSQEGFPWDVIWPNNPNDIGIPE